MCNNGCCLSFQNYALMSLRIVTGRRLGLVEAISRKQVFSLSGLKLTWDKYSFSQLERAMLILISICSSFHVRFCLIHDGFKIVIPHHVRALVSASVRNLRNIIRIDANKSLSANYMFYHLYKSRCISEWYNSMLPFFYQDVEFKSINRFISTLITLIYKSFYCNVKVSLVLLSCSRNFVR